MRAFCCALGAIVLGLVAVTTASATDKIYKWVDDKGVTHYSGKPPAESVEHEIFEPPTDSAVKLPEQQRQELMKGQRQYRRSYNQRRAERHQLQQSLTEARKRLKTARSALEQGKQVRQGERLPGVGGASRLTQAYLQRIKALEAEVQAAEIEVRRLKLELRDL